MRKTRGYLNSWYEPDCDLGLGSGGFDQPGRVFSKRQSTRGGTIGQAGNSRRATAHYRRAYLIRPEISLMPAKRTL